MNADHVFRMRRLRWWALHLGLLAFLLALDVRFYTAAMGAAPGEPRSVAQVLWWAANGLTAVLLLAGTWEKHRHY